MVEAKKLRWLIFTNSDRRFPYRLFIEEYPAHFLCLQVQDRWPGPEKQVYCLRDGHLEEENLPEEQPVEACFILSKRAYGKKLEIILDRKTRKRCWFLFLAKEYKTKPGVLYEQIFWITQSSAKLRRKGAYIPRGRKDEAFEVIIDTRERYAYRFGKAQARRENLPAGDYALVKNGKVLAVAERKTRDNLLHEIATYDVLKAALQELRHFKYKAVVFESPYADFINPKKNNFYQPSYVAEIMADLVFNFPDVQFVFCDSRKIANEWVCRWFDRINREAE